MKVYRDCINGVPPFDGFPDSQGNITDAVFTIFDDSNHVEVYGIFTPLSLSTVGPNNNSPCIPVFANFACVEEALYEAFVTLPANSGGYYIAYQRCCRNNTILNLINPGSVGATYWEHIPGSDVVTTNSSPRFTNRPPIYICQNLPIQFDHIATDPDGDSLVYTLCTPFEGLGVSCPVIDEDNPNCPLTNTPPPYSSVPFSSPYTSSFPLASNPAININSNTGFLDGVPTLQGQWVVGVCVDEYRNGILISTHHRDFQFNVINCIFQVQADIVSETTTNNGQGTGFCNGFTISYSNNSDFSTFYFWDFGDTTTLADTSRLEDPTYTFPSIGDYTITLIANPNTHCADTTTEIFHIHPLLLPDYIVPVGQCLDNNSFDFIGGGEFEGSGTFNWNFGANASPQTANTVNVDDVNFNAIGVYTVGFTVNENGCSATATKTIEVFQNPVASIGNFVTSGCVPQTITFNNTSTAITSMNYLWSFSNGATSTQINPVQSFTLPGIYSVSLTVMTSQKCIDTSQVSAVNSVTIFPIPVPAFTTISSTGQCIDNNSFDFVSTGTFQGTSGTLNWDFGPGSSPQSASTTTVNNISYNSAGIYTVSLIASEFGCADTAKQIIKLYQNPVAAVQSFTQGGCDPQITTFSNLSTASSNMSFLWSFSDGTISTQENPTHVFSPAGIYTYTLSVFTTQNCVDTSIIFSVNSITVSPTPIAGFTANPMETSIFEPDVNFFNNSSSDAVFWHYDFGDGSSAMQTNPSHTYTHWGDYEVTQTITNSFGCPSVAKILVKILPEFRFWVPNAFTPGGKDSLNEIFKPVVIGVEDYIFTIYNRWGELIYTTDDIEKGWNGTFNGLASPIDVYVWKCDFKNIVSKDREYHIGHVTLVR